MSEHVEVLSQWWESAEEGAPSPGDTIITNLGGGEYLIGPASEYWSGREQYGDIRILARAPKPKPAWHDAVAVIAEVHTFDLPRVFVKGDDGIWNDALTGRGHSPEALSHVTPLIEAKVTDEMVTRAQVEMMRLGLGDYSERTIASILTAALGLESK